MESILLCQVDEKTATKIKRLAGAKKIAVKTITSDLFNENLKTLVQGKKCQTEADRVKDRNPDAPSQSLMLFCGLSEKHLDKLLFEMRRDKLEVDYKAVLTATNQNWTMHRLYQEMQREKANL